MKISGEYIEVSQYLLIFGSYHLAKKAHETAILPSDATALVWKYCKFLPTFRGYRGRANRNKITLPAKIGLRPEGIPYLRVGIVLHEIAHTLTMRKHNIVKVKPHGKEYCEIFSNLLKEYYSQELAIAAGSK